MIKLAAAAAAALTLGSAAVAQEYTAPVAPEATQAAYGSLNNAAVWTAVGIVVVGALIVDNQQSNATGTNPPSN